VTGKPIARPRYDIVVLSNAETNAYDLLRSWRRRNAPIGNDAMTKIDDVQNEGGGTGRKNWQYRVNETYGDRSFAAIELQAQDVVQ
jgi:hypothetical protein